MDLTFTAKIWEWRGPRPYFFLTVPEAESGMIDAVSQMVTYGWGMIPANCRIGETSWKTALFPKNGGYVVPLKDAVRRAEHLELGADVVVRVTLDV